MDLNKPVTVGRAADICGLDRTTIFRWVQRGKLCAHRTPGGHFRITLHDLITFARERGISLELPAEIAYDPPLRVLCVDDEEGVLLLYEQIFHAQFPGTEVFVARDGIMGCVRVGAYAPDLIVVDLRMPNLDGLKFCEIMKQNRETEHLAIIVVSAYINSTVAHRLKMMGVDAVLAKPVETSELVRTIKRVNRHRLERMILERRPRTAVRS